jgi:hypothetical protein
VDLIRDGEGIALIRSDLDRWIVSQGRIKIFVAEGLERFFPGDRMEFQKGGDQWALILNVLKLVLSMGHKFLFCGRIVHRKQNALFVKCIPIWGGYLIFP